MIKITCPACHKPLSIDETRLPMKEVSFPCPSCKAKVSLDRRNLPDGASEIPAAAPPAAPDPLPAAVSHAANEYEHDDYSKRAILVGGDSPAIRQAAKAIGFSIMHFPTAEAARDFFCQEFPPIVFLYPQQLTPPPLAEMSAIMSVSSVDRRRGFFILVADNLKTFDGNAAFLYTVNLVIASKDLGNIKAIYHDADSYHKRLYASLNTLTV